MRVTWSLPVRGERLDSSRGDLVRARALIAGLRASGHEVRVVEAAAAPVSAAATVSYRRLVRRILPRPAALVLRDLGRLWHGWMHARRVARVAQAQAADVIIETQVHFAGSGGRAARLADVPLLLDDCSPVAEESRLGAGLPSLAARVMRRQVQQAAAVVVSSRELARQLGTELDGREIHVVPNAVDLDAYLRAAAVRGHPAPARPCTAVFVGSFQPWHEPELLPRALAALPADLPLRLLLVGEGPQLSPTLRLAARLGVAGRITSIGAVPVTALPRVLADCDIGVLPGSNCYGQPMKLLEYGAAGLPAIAPDLAPVRELIEPERTGLLFAPGDSHGLAEHLALLAREPRLRRALGTAARARVAAEATWAGRASQLLALSGCAGRPRSMAGSR